MVDKKRYIIGTLLLILLASGIVYISMNNVRLRVDYDKSTFYTKNLDENGDPYGWWRVTGREYNRLFDGSSIMYRSASDITIDTEVDERNNKVTIKRTTPYIRGPKIVDTYKFDGSLDDIELFPISHTVEIYNGSGYFYRYTVDELKDTGDKRKLTGEIDLSFGMNMDVELNPGYRWAWIGWPYGDDSLSAQYDINSDYETFSVRLFDPPSSYTFDSVEFGYYNQTEATDNGVRLAGLNTSGDYKSFIFYNSTSIYWDTTLTHNATVGNNITLETRTADSYNLSDSGLVSLWGFNNDNSTTAFDETGRNNGTRQGGILNATEGNGTVGKGYWFDGNDAITGSNVNSFNSTEGAISVWMESTADTASSAWAFALSDSSSYNTYLGLNYRYASSEDDIVGWLKLDGVHQWKIYTEGTLATDYLNEWHHVVLNQNGTEPQIYVDGNLMPTTIGYAVDNSLWIDDTLSASNPVTQWDIGRIYGTQNFQGNLDEVRIYNRSLSAEEVQNLYELGSYHIEDWTDWTDKGKVDNSTLVTSSISGKFFQHKADFLTNDTSPYLTSQTVTANGCPSWAPIPYSGGCLLNSTYSASDGEVLNSSFNIFIGDNGDISNSDRYSKITLDLDNNLTILSSGFIQGGNVSIYAHTLNLSSGALINVDYLGFGPSAGPGDGNNIWVDKGGGGAGHGGIGGRSAKNIGGGTYYGNFTYPKNYGSGGGNSEGSRGLGGSGGGVIYINTSKIYVSGVISSRGDGGDGSAYNSGGGGSGGSVLLETTDMYGDGTIRVNGGLGYRGYYSAGGGGAGGYIAVYYDNNTFNGNYNSIGAYGRDEGGRRRRASEGGAPGIIYLKDNQETRGSLLVDNNDNYPGSYYSKGAVIPEGTFSLKSINVTNKGLLDIIGTINISNTSIYTDSDSYITNMGELILTKNYVLDWGLNQQQGGILTNLQNLTVTDGGKLSHKTPVWSTQGNNSLNITVNKLNVTSTGSIYLFLRGFVSTIGPGAGSGSGNYEGGGGAGHGGTGGLSESGRSGGSEYGSYDVPVNSGSGGGVGFYNSAGGPGGGSAFIIANETIIDGDINAKGDEGEHEYYNAGGGGSGGGIYINSGKVTISSSILVDGGDGGNGGQGDGGGGAGGRIHIVADNLTITGTLSSNKGTGPDGAKDGEIGTILIEFMDDLDVSSATFSTPVMIARKDDNYGRIVYTNKSQTTNNSISFKDLISISDNLIDVNSSANTDLNVTAQLTFYNTSLLGYGNLSPYRNGEQCSEDICTVVQDADTYIYNVTHFTNYSVGEKLYPPVISNISEATSGGFSDGSYIYLQVIDYINSTVTSSASNLTVNVSVIKPDDSYSIINASMSNISDSWSYTNDFTLDQIGNWTIRIYAENEDGTDESSRTFNVTASEPVGLFDGYFGYKTGDIPDNSTISNLAYYDYNLIELNVNSDNFEDNQSAIKNTFAHSKNIQIKTGLVINLTYNLSNDTASRDTLISNITEYVPDYKVTPYIEGIEYIKVNVDLDSGYSDANITDNLNLIGKELFDQTDNFFSIYTNYNSTSLEDQYIQYGNLNYLTASDQSSLINNLANLSKSTESKTRIFYDINDTLKTTSQNYYNDIIIPLTSNALLTSNITQDLVTELTNGDLVVCNNQSSKINVSYNLSNGTDIVNQDVYDYSIGVLLENKSDGNINFLDISGNRCDLILTETVDHVEIKEGLASSTVYKTTGDEIYNRNYTDGTRDNAVDSATFDFSISLWDGSYTRSPRVCHYYGWLNSTENPAQFNDCTYIIIADDNNAEIDTLISGTNATVFMYNYVGGFKSTNSTWLADKKSEVDSVNNLNESLGMFFDGLDAGNIDDPTAFEGNMSELREYTYLTKGMELSINVFTDYSEFAQYPTSNGFAMKESCVRKWYAAPNGSSNCSGDSYNATHCYAYDWQYWEDYGGYGDYNKSKWYNKHNVDVLCTAFMNRNHTNWVPRTGNYSLLETIHLASSVLGYNIKQANTPFFNILYDDYYYDVGDKLQLFPTKEGDLYKMKYTKGTVYYNSTNHEAWIDDGLEFNNAKFEISVLDPGSVVTYTVNVNDEHICDITTDGAGWQYEIHECDINETVWEKSYGHYTFVINSSAGGYIGSDTDTSNYGYRSFYRTAGNDGWSVLSTENLFINLITNITHKDSIDETNKITQTNTDANQLYNVSIDSDYNWSTEIWTYCMNATNGSLYELQAYNSTDWVSLDSYNDSDCLSAPTFNVTSVQGVGNVGSCIMYSGDGVCSRASWPELSNQIYRNVMDNISPTITVNYPNETYYNDYSNYINISIDEDGNCSLNDTKWSYHSGTDRNFSFYHSTSGASMCYQETANETSTCGGLDTGGYLCSGIWASPTAACSKVYDGNWSSSGWGLAGNTGYLEINYTKPTDVTGIESIWDNLTALNYDKITASAEGNLMDIYFKSDGTRFYEVDKSGNIYQHSCVTAWDLSSCSYDSVSISTEDSNPQGISFKSDGTKLFTTGAGSDKFYEYDCTDAWNLSSCSYNSNSLNTQESTPKGMYFKPDGTKLYEIGKGDHKIFQHTCGVAWTLTSCAYNGVNINAQDTSDASGLFFNPDGTDLYETGYGDDLIYKSDCSEAWNLSTCTYSGMNISTQDNDPQGIFINPNGTKLYESGSTASTVYQYSGPINSLWQVKDGAGTTNLTINTTCWEYNSDKLMFRAYASDGANTGVWQCYNGSWVTMRSGGAGELYEEAMWWELAGSSTLDDGNYNVLATCSDEFENNNTELITFTIDTTNPKISFVTPPTPENDSSLLQDWIVVNITLIEENVDTLLYRLWNSTWSNETTYNTSVYSINWTNVSYGEYNFWVSIEDSAGNTNITETRTVELVDRAPAGTIWIMPKGDYDNSLWMIEFGRNGSSSVPEYNSTACGSYEGASEYVNSSKIGAYALSYSAESSSYGRSEKQRFGINNFPRRFYSNSYRVFFEINETLTANTSTQIDINLTEPLIRTGIDNGWNKSTDRIYRVSRNGGIYNDTNICYEQPISAN